MVTTPLYPRVGIRVDSPGDLRVAIERHLRTVWQDHLARQMLVRTGVETVEEDAKVLNFESDKK